MRKDRESVRKKWKSDNCQEPKLGEGVACGPWKVE